jgi:hypothetical protein
MEGPHLGELTLFVKGEVEEASILTAATQHSCKRIYFGAGMMSPFRVLTVNKFLKLGFFCTVEGLDHELLQQLPDESNLTVHYSIYVRGVRENSSLNQLGALRFDKATVAYKVDTGKTCLFFNTMPTSINTFDGYPSDTLIYHEEKS